MNKIIDIENRLVGKDQPCFIIGEIGSNHNRDKKTVIQLIDACAEAGFDAVKFQIYDAEEAFSKNEMTTDVKLDHLYGVKPWWEVARDVILMPREWFGEMFAYARENNLIPLSAIHRKEDADFLLEFDLPAFKIASIDLYYHYLLKQLTVYKKPMIISTGMANQTEVSEAIKAVNTSGSSPVILLHCTSIYPTPEKDVNLNRMVMLRKVFNVPVGFSDHTTGSEAAIQALSMGARLFEKHFTLDKNMPGPDHRMSLEPNELKATVDIIRKTELALGSKNKRVLTEEEENRSKLRKSIVALVDIPVGTKLKREMLAVKRPGHGVAPGKLHELLHYQARIDIAKDSTIQYEMLEK